VVTDVLVCDSTVKSEPHVINNTRRGTRLIINTCSALTWQQRQTGEMQTSGQCYGRSVLIFWSTRTSWTHRMTGSKKQLDPFNGFYTDHGCDRQTDGQNYRRNTSSQTDRITAAYVLLLHAMCRVNGNDGLRRFSSLVGNHILTTCNWCSWPNFSDIEVW